MNYNFEIGEIIIHQNEYDGVLETYFFQIVEITEYTLVIRNISSRYISISTEGCNISPRKDKFTELFGTREIVKDIVKEFSTAYDEDYDVDIPFPTYFRFDSDICFTMESCMVAIAEFAGNIYFKDGEGYDPYDAETENAIVTVVAHDGERSERNFKDILMEYNG